MSTTTRHACARSNSSPTSQGQSLDRFSRKSTAETVVDLGSTTHQNQKANDFGVISWSEWQDLNLRPLRPERK
jgi:hypothetical protein